MTALIVEQMDPSVVVMEWPRSDIDPAFWTIEQHAALVTAAGRQAVQLGVPGDIVRKSSCAVATATDRDVFRFVWSVPEDWKFDPARGWMHRIEL